MRLDQGEQSRNIEDRRGPDLARTRDRCRSLYLRHNQHNYSRTNSTADRGHPNVIFSRHLSTVRRIFSTQIRIVDKPRKPTSKRVIRVFVALRMASPT